MEKKLYFIFQRREGLMLILNSVVNWIDVLYDKKSRWEDFSSQAEMLPPWIEPPLAMEVIVILNLDLMPFFFLSRQPKG